jgi:hypothetical protein
MNNLNELNREKSQSLLEMNLDVSSGKFVKLYIIGNFKNPLVSREQLNKQGATK